MKTINERTHTERQKKDKQLTKFTKKCISHRGGKSSLFYNKTHMDDFFFFWIEAEDRRRRNSGCFCLGSGFFTFTSSSSDDDDDDESLSFFSVAFTGFPFFSSSLLLEDESSVSSSVTQTNICLKVFKGSYWTHSQTETDAETDNERSWGGGGGGEGRREQGGCEMKHRSQIKYLVLKQLVRIYNGIAFVT